MTKYNLTAWRNSVEGVLTILDEVYALGDEETDLVLSLERLYRDIIEIPMIRGTEHG